MKRALLIVGLLLVATFGYSYPKPGGYVNDYVGKLSHQQIHDLAVKIGKIKKMGGPEIAVAIVPSLEGQTQEQYAKGLMDTWGVGTRGRNDGIVVLISTGDRKIQIQVGSGCQSWLPQYRAEAIYSDVMRPKLRNGDWYGGIFSAIQVIESDYQEANQPVSSSDVGSSTIPSTHNVVEHDNAGTIAVVLMVILLIIAVIGGIVYLAKKTDFFSEDDEEDETTPPDIASLESEKILTPVQKEKLKAKREEERKAKQVASKLRKTVHKSLEKMSPEDRRKALKIMRRWKAAEPSERKWVSNRVPHIQTYVVHDNSDSFFNNYMFWYLVGNNNQSQYAPAVVNNYYEGGSSGGAGSSGSWGGGSSSSSDSSGSDGGFSGFGGGSSDSDSGSSFGGGDSGSSSGGGGDF